MRDIQRLSLAIFAAALACASAPPAATRTRTPTPTSTSTGGAWAGVALGMDAADVRRRLGDPGRVEQVPSAAVHGARYERWSYGAREVVFVDGKVIDLIP